MKHSKALKKVLKQVVVGLIMCSMIIPGLTGIASASSAAGEIRWDFIEGKEVASIYKETTSDTATLDHGDGAVKINATKVTQGKAVGIALTDNITIDTDVHKYILFKADFPANITKISAYLYNSEGTNIAYGWANNANALFAGISEGTKVYALPLSASNSGTTANASAVVNGTYGKLEIRFRCGKTNESTLAENSVISIDYVAIGSYNKDAVMTDGTTTGSKKGTEEKTVMISAINVGSKAYALNETANGYTISGMSADYENLATASITATAAEGWTVSNTATKVTELTNHKIVDAVVTATNGSESKTASYRYVFYPVEDTGEIRWDFIEGKEVAGIYMETGAGTATLDHGDGAVKINATKVSQGKAVGIALTDNITIDTDVHKYILFKADFPANITKISAYLYNSAGTAVAYTWENNPNAIFAGIIEGTAVYALPLSASYKSGSASAVVDGTYGKLELRFRCGKTNESTLAENSVISIDYVAIGSYNKDAVMTDGTTTGSKKGTEEKTVMISAINVGSKAYALNETANGYTISGMSADYENLATASITATAAEGWTVSNTATKVTELTNHKIVDAVVTATNGSESKTASYRYVFYLVEETGDSVFTTVTTKSATSVNDKSVGSDGTFGEATAWSYNGTPNKEFLPIRGVNTNYSSNEGNGRDKNIGISTFDFSASKDFADEFVVTYNMWAGTDVLPGVYLVPDNATKLSDCTLLGKITATKWNNWAYSDFDVTETVKADDDGIITLGLYVADEDYATSTLKARQLLIQHSAGTRDGKAYGTINNRTDLANVPEKSTVTVTRKVVEGAEDAPVSIVPIIAHYNSDNQLVNCTLGQEFEHTGSSTVVSATLDTFSYEDGDYLRAFYWNNMLDITPVLDAQGL